MKIKILLASAFCFVLLLFTGCGNQATSYSDGGSSAEQEQTETTDETRQNTDNVDKKMR